MMQIREYKGERLYSLLYGIYKAGYQKRMKQDWREEETDPSQYTLDLK